ncbi:MAG TPA: CBS domain-containing protein [Polyangiaceae bacterium]|nr:CBS domain-containing protein [Polyangiaceae bacterium]
MIVADMMCRFPVIVSPDISCARALSIAEEHGSHFLLAVDANDLLGVLRSCDLKRAHPATRAGRTIHGPVMPIGVTDSLTLATRMLTLGGAGCLVVVDDDSCLHGIVTRQDLFRVGVSAPERGVDCCAACGAQDHLIFGGIDQPAFCCGCLDTAKTLISSVA